MTSEEFIRCVQLIRADYERKYRRDRTIFSVFAILILCVLAILLVSCQAPLRSDGGISPVEAAHAEYQSLLR